MSALPTHIAIIMDGNGRWAQNRGLPRTIGHKHGAEAVRRVVRASGDMGIQYLTLFGFSSENWARPEKEIKDLMRQLRYYLRSETAELHKSNVRLRVIGDRSAFESDIIKLIENAERLMADNTGLTLMIALNYGGQNDIAHAVQGLLQEHHIDHGDLHVEDIAFEISNRLMTGDAPSPDIVIRTSGEQRISNFLLWQSAYSELVFTDTLWPDFDKEDLEAAIAEYAGRDRRFGALKHSKG